MASVSLRLEAHHRLLDPVTDGLRAATPPGMASLGGLLGRRPAAPALVEVKPPCTADDARAALGPQATEVQVAALVQADQRRWAYQQRKAKEKQDLACLPSTPRR